MSIEFKGVKDWQPDRPASKGASAYREAVVNAGWHIQNISGLIALIQNLVHGGDVVVDFGAGTGASALYILKQIHKKFTLILVDNSASWLGKSYELLHHLPNVQFRLEGKRDNRFDTLDEVLGSRTVDHVISANTVHLIPNIEENFTGVANALKKGGYFTFQSGNILNPDRKPDLLMIDDTVRQVHDIAVKLIRVMPEYKTYKIDLSAKIKADTAQRQFVFPPPRKIDFYFNALDKVGFIDIKVKYRRIKVEYIDWLNFLRVRRLQAGILPEVGGKRLRGKRKGTGIT